jgi:hypothetical protein
VLPPTQEEIEAALRAVAPETAEKFAADIQPLLLSRCGLAACHGTNSTAEYRLVRPPLKHVNKTRETQRNLFATLGQIGIEGDSPLLSIAVQPHGGADEPSLTAQDRRQIEQLSAWIDKVRQPPAKAKEAKSDPGVRRAAFEQSLPEKSPAGTRRLPGVDEPRAFEPADTARELSPSEQPASPSEKNPAKKSAARDPFDPKTFNERYHGDK